MLTEGHSVGYKGEENFSLLTILIFFTRLDVEQVREKGNLGRRGEEMR